MEEALQYFYQLLSNDALQVAPTSSLEVSWSEV